MMIHKQFLERAAWPCRVKHGGLLVLTIAILTCFVNTLIARDNGQWGDQPPEIRSWFRSVMQPGFENTNDIGHSCCGTGDAFEVTLDGDNPDGSIRAVIIDGKGVMEAGTVINVPREKLQPHYSNPLDAYILFLSGAGYSNSPLCLIPKSGV